LSADITSKIESSVVLPLNILVVDDDELNQRMMHVILNREGHQVSIASNGLEAFNLVKLHKYDVVLMDLQMPVWNGVETSRRIREWENGGNHTFIVALTASYLPENGQELFDAGVDNYISKPFDLEHLRQLLMYSYNDRRVVDDTTLGVVANVPGFDCEVGLKRVGGDEEMYKELLGDFIQELPGRLESLYTCILNNDFESLSRIAHNLKGVSANLGFIQLSEYAHKIEDQVSKRRIDSIKDILVHIETVADKLRKL
jgi:CheY-like chemotaxis protein